MDGRGSSWFVRDLSRVGGNILSRLGLPGVGPFVSGWRESASASSLFLPGQCSTEKDSSSRRQAHLASFERLSFTCQSQVSALLSVLMVK